MTSILVRAPNWIGDQILAYPFFYYLRKSFPDAWIGVACVEWVKDLQFKNLVDEVFLLPRSIQDTVSERLRAIESGAKQLRESRDWDYGISLPNSFSSAWLLYRAKARVRIGYRMEGRGLFLTQGLRWPKKGVEHRAQAYLHLLPEGPESSESTESKGPKRPVTEFWGIPPENKFDLGVRGELKEFPAAQAWPDVAPLDPPQDTYWVLAPGSTAESRRWPPEFFAQLAHKIYAETGWKGMIVGGPKEAPLASELIDLVHEMSSTQRAKIEDWTAQCSVPGLWRIFQKARFTVSNESGLAHMAALCGSFVQIVCGAADPRRTRPLGPGKVQVAVHPVGCWPCERNTCSQPAGQKLRCLIGTQPETVWEEIKRGLG